LRSSAVRSAVPTASPDAPDQNVLTGTVAHLYDGSLLLAGEGAHELYMIPTTVSIFGLDGNAADAGALKAGQTVEISYSGGVMESYPMQLGGNISVKITAEGDDLIGLYLSALNQLWMTDEGLNSDIQVLAFDLTKTSNLTESQKSALIYIESGLRGLEGIAGTYDELCEQGYIDKDALYFETGLLITLEVTAQDEAGFTFNASKWRSGRGAYFFTDCRAEKTDSVWGYTVGSEAIS
jgi:hypothetical protein